MSSLKIFSQVASPLKEEYVNVEKEIEERGKKPEYPGGINAFRKNFSQTFDGSKINDKGMVKSEAQFIISEEGIVTDIVTLGNSKSMNKEMERSIKAMSKTKWKPAELDGKPVKYRFKLPITMTFQ